MFFWGGYAALSASKTIAQLWDGRLKGDIGLVCPVGGRMVSPEDADQEAPMPGHLIQGGDTRRVIPRGITDRGIP